MMANEMSGVVPALRRSAIAAGLGLAVGAASLAAGTAFFVLSVVSLALFTIGVGIFLFPAVTLAIRAAANVQRELAHTWAGVQIPRPYRAAPANADYGVVGHWLRCKWILTDPATWRDLVWALVSMTGGLIIAILPAALILEGIFGWLLGVGLWRPIVGESGTYWYAFIPVGSQRTAFLAMALGTIWVPLGIWLAPRMLKIHARIAHSLLAPTKSARIQHLTETRHEAVDTQAAELRRIERDLHDGAQARLVAMGMTLGTAEQLLDNNPQAARTLLVEARQASATALTELRDLVRGIHPPVLADRGLADAVRALALDSPLRVEVHGEVPGRLEAPVESAAYFAVSEIITNAAKHSGARQVQIEMRHESGALKIKVTDDGRGGASMDGGTGLRGLERRLATFDGVLALSSPPGGPTVVGIGIPCEIMR